MIIQYVFAVLAVIVVVMVLAVIILSDLKKSMVYLKSHKATGFVVEKAGEQSMAAYGTSRKRHYTVYHVRCSVHGSDMILEAASKKRDVAPGNILVVRYIECPDGRICEVFPYEWDRLRELLIGTVFGILLAVLCIIYKL